MASARDGDESEVANLKSDDSDAAVIEVSDYTTGSYLLVSASSDPVVSGRPAAVADGSMVGDTRVSDTVTGGALDAAAGCQWRRLGWGGKPGRLRS